MFDTRCQLRPLEVGNKIKFLTVIGLNVITTTRRLGYWTGVVEVEIWI